MKQKSITVSVIIPAYNEAGNLPVLIPLVVSELKKSLRKNETYELLVIDDGSIDETPKQLKTLQQKYKELYSIRFSRNFGHQSALMAGLELAVGECVISMDADLQHPPKLLSTLLLHWRKGKKVVYTVRRDPDSASILKRFSSRFFYIVFRFLSGVSLDPGVADFRLLDRKVVDVVKTMSESTMFLRGIIAWAGFDSVAVPYIASKRFRGTSQYTIIKMLKLAVGGITSFSVRPLYMMVVCGILLSVVSGMYGVYAVIMFLLYGKFVLPGWASIISSVLFIGGVQLILLGVVGIYIGNIYIETKRRPRYIIDSINAKKVK
ncbi:glycosyltransferase family 2 protein [Candidatus Woesebacteria bacterium]|nr:glycosyltransferase family 2 protein [Candidatus Woesebacteria bacterium]